MLRERGVVGKFVEFFGPGLAGLGLADRATIGNMSPEFGSTCAIFPPDAETLRYLEFTGRPTELIELVDAYTREQGFFHTEDSEEPTFSDTLELELADVEPSIAGPKRPQDRIALTNAKAAFFESLAGPRSGCCGGAWKPLGRGDCRELSGIRPPGGRARWRGGQAAQGWNRRRRHRGTDERRDLGQA